MEREDRIKKMKWIKIIKYIYNNYKSYAGHALNLSKGVNFLKKKSSKIIARFRFRFRPRAFNEIYLRSLSYSSLVANLP